MAGDYEMKRILVVDDNKRIHSSVEVLFGDDYQLLHAFNFKDVKAMTKIKFDLILLDRNFNHDFSVGLKIAVYLKRNLPDIPVIVFSANVDGVARRNFKRLGVKDFLVKGYDVFEQKAVVDSYLKIPA